MTDRKVKFAFKNIPIQDIDAGYGLKNVNQATKNTGSSTEKTATLPLINAVFTRATWLRILHGICFLLHVAFFTAVFIIVGDYDMSVTVKRMRPSWGPNQEYFHTIRPANNQYLAFDTLTLFFFGASATMHAMWLFFGGFAFANAFLWECLDNCLCWWRWAEYSISASVMMVTIAIATGIADQNTIIGIFALSFITMWCGFFTELVSRPAKNSDGTVNYERWEGDPTPLKDDDTKETKSAHRWTKVKNYGRRMFPHVMGIFPYMAAWMIIIMNWDDMLDDFKLCEKADKGYPEWVPMVVYGCFVIFSFFTFVQWRYQWIAPEHYWRTEIWYCILSATSKIALGVVLTYNLFEKAEDPPTVEEKCHWEHTVEERCNYTLAELRKEYTGCDSTGF